MSALDPSQKSVKLFGDHHSIETKPQRAATGLLCNHCALQDTCEIKRDMDQIQATHYVALSVRSCAHFRPLLGFAPPLKGFTGRFNSFRMGRAWSERVKPGKVIGLLDTKTQQIFGSAHVVGVDHGPLDAMLELHAAENHYIKATEHPNPEQELFRIMRNLIGTGFVRLERDASVVIMERLDEPQETLSTGACEAGTAAARSLL